MMNPTKAPLNRQVQLDDKYTIQTGRAYMTGIEALVRLPMLQQQRDQQRGLNTAGFISGYRGSPLGGVDQSLWQARDFLKRQNIHFQPGVNEELAATVVYSPLPGMITPVSPLPYPTNLSICSSVPRSPY